MGRCTSSAAAIRRSPRATSRRLARAVRAAGIKRVTGSIVGDETMWDSRRDAPGWKSGFLGEECPPLSALTLSRNPSGRSATARRGRAAAGAAQGRRARLGHRPRRPGTRRRRAHRLRRVAAHRLAAAHDGQEIRQLHGRDGAEGRRRERVRPRHHRQRRAPRAPGSSRPRPEPDRLPRRRRLRPVEQRPHDHRTACPAARGRLPHRVDRRAAAQLAVDRRQGRDALRPHDDRPRARPSSGPRPARSTSARRCPGTPGRTRSA